MESICPVLEDKTRGDVSHSRALVKRLIRDIRGKGLTEYPRTRSAFEFGFQITRNNWSRKQKKFMEKIKKNKLIRTFSPLVESCNERKLMIIHWTVPYFKNDYFVLTRSWFELDASRYGRASLLIVDSNGDRFIKYDDNRYKNTEKDICRFKRLSIKCSRHSFERYLERAKGADLKGLILNSGQLTINTTGKDYFNPLNLYDDYELTVPSQHGLWLGKIEDDQAVFKTFVADDTLTPRQYFRKNKHYERIQERGMHLLDNG